MDQTRIITLIPPQTEEEAEEGIPSHQDPNILAREAGKIVSFCLEKRLAFVGNGDSDVS
jgi:hypothetical protein